jgi:D-serine deaminase-like pyridoxal phosphate-dependent protein
MSTRPSVEPGTPLAALATPALVVDAAALERNLARMARFARESGIALRAHAKTHKCPAIGLQQIALGAVGLCCQTVREAEALVSGGIRNILVSNQVVGPGKIERLAALARRARIGVCVDDASNVADLSAAAARHGATLDVLVEINVGMDRCGVSPGTPALELARAIANAPGLHFGGLQAYQGRAQHLRTFDERHAAITRAIDSSRQTRDLILSCGLDCPSVTGAGTGTFAIEAASGVYTEIQAGSYVFMDADYARNRNHDGAVFADFEHSLFVLGTVISHVTPDRAVVDAGLKAIGVDAGLPVVAGLPGARYTRASDEHGILDLTDCPQPLRLGDKLQLIPGNCDPTVNLYDNYVVVRDQRVAALWPIVARGPGH